jgi:superfamily II DNA or RNA helicase
MNVHPIVIPLRARPISWPGSDAVASFAAFEAWVRSLPMPERGPAWEGFVEAYLVLTPALDIETVWRPADPYLPDEVLARLGLERKDVGQDFIARTRSGALWIVQAKFRSKGDLLWEDVRGAVAAGRNAERVLFVSNAGALGGNCPPLLLNTHVGAVLRHDLAGLGDAFFMAWATLRAGRRPTPRAAEGRYPHQMAAVRDVIAAFEQGAERTQLVAACGTGKTRMALWVMEDLDARRVVFFAPSLALVSQTVAEWSAHAQRPLDIVCVCSDKDAGEMSAYEVAVPVTTETGRLRAQWLAPLEAGRRRVVFATYHSADVVQGALSGAEGEIPRPALVVCDEAHRIAGYEAKAWQIVLDNDAIPAARRLFMTATQRLVAPEIQALGVSASMDNETLFGAVAHRISFRDAINLGLLADYRIHVIGVPTTDRRAAELVRRRKFVLQAPTGERPYDASEVAQALALEQALDQGLFRYAFTFHSRIAHARRFGRLMTLVWRPELVRETDFNVITGEQPLRERRAILERALAHPHGVISSVRALSEGVDVPAVDAVVFADPKESVIDIVQAIGRALRKRPGAVAKTASILIPVPVPKGAKPDEVIADTAWATVWHVLEAMAQHDGELAEHLAALRTELGPRRVPGGRSTDHARRYVTQHLTIHLPDGKAFAVLREAVQIAVLDRGDWAFWHMLAVFRRTAESRPLMPALDWPPGPAQEDMAGWVREMRERFANQALPAPQADALAATPGWYWTEQDEAWGIGCEKLRQFAVEFGQLPSAFRVEGDDFELRAWLTRAHKDLARGALTQFQAERLRALPGWIEDPEEATLAGALAVASLVTDSTAFASRVGRRSSSRRPRDDWKPGPTPEWWRWLDRQRARYHAGELPASWIQRLEALPGWTWTPQEDHGAQMLAELERYVATHGSVPSPCLPKPSRALSEWLPRQRGRQQRGTLPAEMATRLAALPGWEWDVGLAEVRRNVDRLRPLEGRFYRWWLPREYETPDGERLGRWVEEQRRRYRAQRLSPEKIALLESLPGWSWKDGEAFARHLELVRAFAAASGGAVMPEGYVAPSGEPVGRWVQAQRARQRSGRPMNPDEVRLLESVPGWSWTRLTDHQERMLELVAAYAQDHEGDLPSPAWCAPDGERVGTWLRTQARADRAGTITPALADRLRMLPAWRDYVRAVTEPGGEANL